MTGSLDAALDDAVAARARLRGRGVRETAVALAEAAACWRCDPLLAQELPGVADLTPAMVEAMLPIVAEALDAEHLVDLHDREGRGGAPPVLVAAVLASNVPALAVPAIAHACLAGAAVVVKSGHADTCSAPAFRRALESVDPDLAATIVTTYWPGGSRDVEDALLPRADVVVATGADATVAALARRLGAKVLPYGSRASVAVLAADASDAEIAALAADVARYDQRGCLSPHAVFALGDPLALGMRLLAALDAVATDLPAPARVLEARAAHRLALEEARFAGADVRESAGGAIVVEARPHPGPPIDGRTVRVLALRHANDLVTRLVPRTIECIGTGERVALDVEALRTHGVARICPVGRMQRPRIDWPRGQRPALGSLFRVASEPRIQVES